MSLAARIRQAERLAAKYGKLPCDNWLRLHHLGGLQEAKRQHPQAFANIPQDKPQATRVPLTEHIKVARQLAAKYGEVPGPGWLCSHEHTRLYNAMRRQPDAFQGIPRQLPPKRRTLKEHVAVAKQLAAKNKGQLPSATDLIACGELKLYHARCRNPAAFKNVPQKRRTRVRWTLEKYVTLATRLAAQNKGKIPSVGWLKTHGHLNLSVTMRAKPEAFVHLPQEKRSAALLRQIAAAERLAKIHGAIPGPGWCHANHYGSLWYMIGKAPDEFRHIPGFKLPGHYRKRPKT
jgi:hypothetical protein